MLIVEGPDGSGKSTLCQRLVGDIPNISIAPRVVGQDAEAMVDLGYWVNENLTQGLQRRIFDRHRLISEPIYGPVLRGDDQNPGFDNINWLMSVQEAFHRLKPFVIWCLPPLETVQENMLKPLLSKEPMPQPAGVISNIDLIYRLYTHRASLSGGQNQSYAVWDYASGTADSDYKTMLQILLAWLDRKGL